MNKPNPFSYVTLVTVVLFIGGCASVAYAQKAKTSETREWLQFRGPNGTGVAEGVTLPAEFGPNKNLVWRTALPFARSSPVVTVDRVFITATEGDKLSTFALDRKTGKIIWRRDVVRARQMQMYKANDGASPSPVSDGKNVFAFFSELGLIAYGPSGNELWRVPLGPFNSFYGMAASPVLAGNTLVMVCDTERTRSSLQSIREMAKCFGTNPGRTLRLTRRRQFTNQRMDQHKYWYSAQAQALSMPIRSIRESDCGGLRRLVIIPKGYLFSGPIWFTSLSMVATNLSCRLLTKP